MTNSPLHSDLLFRSKPMTVRPEWIDYNGHLNMAYYSVLHVDQAGPRVAPMPDHIIANLRKFHTAQSPLPWPDRAGRKIGIHRKG